MTSWWPDYSLQDIVRGRRWYTGGSREWACAEIDTRSRAGREQPWYKPISLTLPNRDFANRFNLKLFNQTNMHPVLYEKSL